MSGRGRYNGGRSNYRGGHGRQGQQGRNGSRGNGTNQQSASGKSEIKQQERFVLTDKPSTTTVNNWFLGQEIFAGQVLSKSGVAWVVNLTQPGDLPFLEPPEPPEEQFYQKIICDEVRSRTPR